MEALIKERVQAWLNGSFDEDTKAAILKMQSENTSELMDSFYKNLEFGTG
jgi:phosphoglucomutase